MKKASIAILFAVLSLPVVTSAAWWNPLTWNVKPHQTEVINSVENVNVPVATTTESKKIETIVEKPLIKEKIVTQTITVDNPELQKKIDALVSENNYLKNKLEQAQDDLSTCQSGLGALKNQAKVSSAEQTNTTQPVVDTTAQKIKDLQLQLIELQHKQQQEIDKINSQGGISKDQVGAEINAINRQYSSLEAELHYQIQKLELQ